MVLKKWGGRGGEREREREREREKGMCNIYVRNDKYHLFSKSFV
jgi:hypothetical protein